MMRFPNDFVWGSAASSYQIEGGWNTDGKGLSIWDIFSHEKNHIDNDETGDIACDHYHRYREDIKLMKSMGIKAYRLSLSWPRILPNGTGAVNEAGLAFYDNLIEELLKNDITPYITLYHWDLPQSLQEKGGWEWDGITDAFAFYAGIVAEHFSDRVTFFATLNEPQITLLLGYLTGTHAPGYKLQVKEAVKVMHYLLLAHGKAVKTMRKKAVQPIKIGAVTTGNLCYPSTETPADISAARQETFTLTPDSWAFNHTWFWDAVIFGKYPDCSQFASHEDFCFVHKEDWDAITQPLDFMGVNVYNGHEVCEKNGKPFYVPRISGYPRTALGWPVTEQVMDFGLFFLYERYNLPIYITENGLACNDKVYLDGKVHDGDRIDFTRRYLLKMQQSIQRGTDIRGYFHWSLMDNFEWHSGYAPRFGLIYIDYPSQKRILKDSAVWYKEVIEKNSIS